jgi:hypothetical protein
LQGVCDTVFDKHASDTATLEAWFDEEPVEFDLTVGPQQHGSETGHTAVHFGHEHMTLGDLLRGKLSGIGMGEHEFSVAGIGQRRAKLQRFEGRPLRRQRAPDRHPIRHGRLPITLLLIVAANRFR